MISQSDDITSVKAQIVSHLRHLTDERKLTQAEAGVLMGIVPEEVSRFFEDGSQQYPLERLLRMLTAFGLDVEITMRPHPPIAGEGGRITLILGDGVTMNRDQPDRTDWAALRAMSEEEIERIAAEDEDNPATDESHWADATVGLPPAALTEDQAANLRALDDALARGIADADVGRVKPIGEAFARIRSRLLATAEEKLRGDIQEGLGSGPAEPHDMAAIKAEARARRSGKLVRFDSLDEMPPAEPLSREFKVLTDDEVEHRAAADDDG